jgi:hypothetical protein
MRMILPVDFQKELINGFHEQTGLIDKGHIATLGEDDQLGSRDLFVHLLRERLPAVLPNYERGYGGINK